MPVLSFTLSPGGVVRIHDAILCLAKFSETVSLEARRNNFVLTALNSSKSAYASFGLESNVFFEKYNFSPNPSRDQRSGSDDESRFTCQIYNKALLSVFKGRLIDARERDTSIERCEVTIQDQPDKTECRLIVKMVCRHGVIKTYKLTYESIEIMHALFDKNAAKNRWSISASVLRSFGEHFGPKTEQLDIYSENGRAMFTSYTEKIMDGKEILKQPLQTSVALDTLDFDEFSVEDKLHIGISVKDFKAIVTHADTLNASIKASYSHPNRPLQLAYKEKGMQCEFTLMTIGDYRGGSVIPAPAAGREISTRPAERPAERPASVQPSAPARSRPVAEAMPPPIEPASRSFARESASQRPRRPSPPPPQASLDPESLFLPAGDDDDRRWDEKNYDEDEEDTLGWDASADHDGMATSLRNTLGNHAPSRLRPYESAADDYDKRIAPTQRISQIRGIFDD